MLCTHVLVSADTREQNEMTTAAFWVEPNSVTMLVNDTFTVNVWLNATETFGWELALAWNNTVLKCVNAQLHIPVQWGGTFDLNQQAYMTNCTEDDYMNHAWLFGRGIENNVTQYLNFSLDTGGVHADPNATCEHGIYDKAVISPPSPDFTSVNVSMPIVTLTFQALQEGTTSFEIINQEMLIGYDPEGHTGRGVKTALVVSDWGELMPFSITNGMVNVRELRDMNNDGVIDIYDAIIMARALGWSKVLFQTQTQLLTIHTHLPR